MSDEFESIIGFEFHAQLTTRTKIFCSCENAPGRKPNTRVCPVCLGMPGVLPVLNPEAVDCAIMVALALGATPSERCSFARKNYFYPDLPKGYQITQHSEPLATGGHLDIEVEGLRKRIRVRQVHIEEDAGKTIHPGAGAGWSLVDMNRCGVPLVEIVSDPHPMSAGEAHAYLVKLRQLLVHLGVATGRMHEGSMRIDTNISIRRRGEETLGTQTEVKNLNSFRAVRKVLKYEAVRQAELLRRGRPVVHETMLWDAQSEQAVPMRSKEESSDYRYFPEPDLIDVVIDVGWIERVRAVMPELPDAARQRFEADYGLPAYDAGVLTAEPAVAYLFEATLLDLMRLVHPELERPSVGREFPFVPVRERVSLLGHRFSEEERRELGDLPAVAKTVSNWIMVHAMGWLNAHGLTADLLPANPPQLAAVILLRLRNEINEPGARKLLETMLDGARGEIHALVERLSEKEISVGECQMAAEDAQARCASPAELVGRLGLQQVSDEEELSAAVREVLEANPDVVARYRTGQKRLLRFLVGQIMKETEGRADPEKVNEILLSELDS